MDSYLKVILTKDFGGAQLTLELSSAKMIGVEGSGIAEFDAAIVKINAMFDHYAVEHLPKLRTNKPIGEVKVFDALRVDVTIDKGRWFIRRVPKCRVGIV